MTVLNCEHKFHTHCLKKDWIYNIDNVINEDINTSKVDKNTTNKKKKETIKFLFNKCPIRGCEREMKFNNSASSIGSAIYV